MALRRRILVLGGMMALAGSASAQEVEWRAVGAPKPAVIVPVQAIEPPQAAPSPVAPPMAVPPTAAPQAPEQISQPFSGIVVPPNNGTVITDPIPMITGSAPADGMCGPELPIDACPTVALCDNGLSKHRYWVRGEFLAWYLKGTSTPPLLTTSTDPLTFKTDKKTGDPIVDPAVLGAIGAIGQAGTVVLLGGNNLDNQFRPGARFSAGWWMDCCECNGIDGSVFFTARRTNTYYANTNQFDTLFRPYFAVNPVIELMNKPGETREVVGVKSADIFGEFAAQNTSFFWGADLNYRRNLWQNCMTRIDGFAGFRYLHLDERLKFMEEITFNRRTLFPDASVPVTMLRAVPPGYHISVYDEFATRNNFYGAQVGTDIEVRRDRWSLNLRPSIAIGGTEQRVSVGGAYRESLNGVTQTPPIFAGLYALSSNSGNRSKGAFTYVPEIGLKVGYDVTSHLKTTIGYDFLYWSTVVRPGDQIDRNLDTRGIPALTNPITRPAPLFETTDFWAQGLNAGLEYRW